MLVAWRLKWICEEWRKANGIYISKELNSTAVTQVRPISLLNVEGKIFFSVKANSHEVLDGEQVLGRVVQTGEFHVSPDA